jgi:adenosylcobinamide-phosphate synthase
MWWPFPVFGSLALALFVEHFTGYPRRLQKRIGHPVEWMGRFIDWLDVKFNETRAAPAEGKLRGLAALGALIAAAFVPSWLIAKTLSYVPLGWVLEALIATAFLAQTSLRRHVEAVYIALGYSLADGRREVGMIVGRDPTQLDESGVVRAALESLAENTSDGIVAPAFWYGALGLPGIVLYKAINTADSMIGHKSERYLHFGWAAARLDDLVNLPCSRLTALLFAFSSNGRVHRTLETTLRDAPKHHSPNAGWPEAAFAAALGLSLGGPRSYDGEAVDLPWMGDGRSELTRLDLRPGLRLYGRALTLLFLVTLVLALVF